MLAVGVHQDDRIARSRLEPRRQGSLLAEVPREAQVVQARLARAQVEHHRSRRVCAAIVHDNNFMAEAGLSENAGNRRDDNRKALALIIRGQDNRNQGWTVCFHEHNLRALAHNLGDALSWSYAGC